MKPSIVCSLFVLAACGPSSTQGGSRTTTTAASEPQDAGTTTTTTTSASSREAPDPAGTTRRGAESWSVALGPDWTDAVSSSVAWSRPAAGAAAGDVLRLVAKVADGSPTIAELEASARELHPDGAAPTRIRVDGEDGVEVIVRRPGPDTRSHSFVRVIVNRTRASLLWCRAPEATLETWRSACRGALDTLTLGTERARAPAALAGQRWIGAQGVFTSVPEGWVELRGTDWAANYASDAAGTAAVVALHLQPNAQRDLRAAALALATTQALGESPTAGESVHAVTPAPPSVGAAEYELVTGAVLPGTTEITWLVAHQGKVLELVCMGPTPSFESDTSLCRAELTSLRFRPAR